MFPVKKVSKLGKEKYYIRYRNDQGKLVYYPKTKYGDFSTEKQALNWINENRCKVTDSKKQAEITKRILMKKKYPDFEDLKKRFLSTQKTEAPNSWKTSELYLDRYICKFYLVMKGVADVGEWYKYFGEFRRFLEYDAEITKGGRLITYSTKNHCIRTLNKFLSVMQTENIIDLNRTLKCKAFPKEKINTRGYKDIFKPEEYLSLKKTLKKSRDYFIILYNSGLRFNELYSLSLADLGDESKAPEHLKIRFKSYQRKVYGYITIDSQIDGKVRSQARKNALEDKKCENYFKRKPLKSCKKIDSKNRRIIPVFDKETWEILVKNQNRVIDEDYSMQKYGEDPKDYFLLDVDPSVLRREFIKHSEKGFHGCRHSFINSLIASGFDQTMVKVISGHRSSAFEAYVHIYEQYAESMANGSDKAIERLKLAS